ncbi:bifunctional nuclease family protein [Mycetocola sp. 2940]|uniref:bifunctional nuclease family protein n=1 Tax=Mycetocola sp. 2940 TaxID=3156452 RepID=UPI003393D53D
MVQVQVHIVGVAVDSSAQHLILLKPLDDDAGRMLPIWIGPQEATSILIAVEGAHAPRPLSHDLMKTLLEAVGASVERVDVTKIEDGTFYAEISLRTQSGRLVLDSRPSDAIAIAARVDAPIWVNDDVLEEAGIADENEKADPVDEEARLDEFRKFLDDVDPEDFQG